MSVCYIDCSPFMKSVMLSHDTESLNIKINIGDPTADEIPNLIKGYPIIFNGHTYMDADLLEHCVDLKSIIFLGTGAASYIDIDAAAKLNIAVHTIKGYGDRSIAEHTFGLIMASARQIAQMDADLRNGIWDPLEGQELAGTTLGIIGCGGIGKNLVSIATAFGMNVRIWNRSKLEGDLAKLQTDFDTVISGSDFISLHLGYNEATRHIIGKKELLAMKQGSTLINTARGGLVDTAALLEALKNKSTLHYAALDVFDTEPLEPNNPLLELPNVTLTSHAAFKTKAASKRLLKSAFAIAQNEVNKL